MILDLTWEFVADTVMGGVSRGALRHETIAGRRATRLTGQVSLDNDGGFVQMAADLPGGVFDASGYDGIALTLMGNGERYDIRLRTDQLTRPWQSHRTEVTVAEDWTTHRLPFSAFQPHRTEIALDRARLRRIGVLAVGRVFHADVAVAEVAVY